MTIKCRNIGCTFERHGECTSVGCDGRDRSIQELLAIIHGDGGHHTREVGQEASITDGFDKVCETNASLDELTKAVDLLIEERDWYHDQLSQAERQRDAWAQDGGVVLFCAWKYDDYDCCWITDCGLTWQFDNDGTPKDNNMQYCPKCGKNMAIFNPVDLMEFTCKNGHIFRQDARNADGICPTCANPTP